MSTALPALLAILAIGTPAQGVLEEAARVRSEGRVAEGVALLLQAADRDRADEFADDCLAEAARWLSDDLHDPVRAIAIWGRLLQRYPGSRHARRGKAAVARLKALGLDGGSGDAAAARELLGIQRNPALSVRERQAQLHGLRDRYPDWAGVARVDEMLAAIERAGPAPVPPPGPMLPLALLAGLLVMAAWGRLWRAPAQVLWPPPMEVAFLAPIYVVLGLAALAQPAGAVRPLLAMLAVVGGGTLAWTWVVAAALRRRSACSSLVRGAVPVAAAAFVVGLCVYAVQWQGLGPEVLETFRGGPER